MDRLTTALADRYEIDREIGQGGMATVYLARDLRHHRNVALKVLRPELSAILGGERFLHEIRTTANLQHPHILPLYDSGDADGLVFYVMPFVSGESLRDRLSRETQLPVEDAVHIAKEVADALDYAHRHGVIHRDIKPENILLHDGRAQVADFGIALAVSSAGGGTRMTETGMSLGTPHYMSPEQAMGEREVSGKADIYALGCVLYEMLVGEPPFTGPSAQAIIARVVTEEPRSLTLQRRSIPPHLEAVVRRALEKLPADRFQSAAQFSAALANPESVQLAARADGGTRARSSPSVAGRRFHPLLVPILASLLVLTAAGAAWGWLRPQASVASPVARFAISLPAKAAYSDRPGRGIAMSPAGDRIVYNGVNDRGELQLFVRKLDQLEPVPLPGTRNASQAFFSPDGSSVAFFNSGRIQKVAVAGGPVLTIATADSGFAGGSWGVGDMIVVGTNGGLRQVPAAGGRLAFLTGVDTSSESSHRLPEFLPDGESVLFQLRDTAGVDRLAAVTLRDGTIKRFAEVGSDPRYVSSGHVLLSSLNGVVVAAPFDPSRIEILGPAVPVVEGVAVTTGGAAKLGVSRDGAFTYLQGSVSARSLVRVDRNGVVQPLSGEKRNYQSPRYSPDGRSIAVAVPDGQGRSDIWVFDVAQKSLTRLTFEGEANRPFWTPDGSRIAFTVFGGPTAPIEWVRADGSAQAERLAGTEGGLGDDWSRDGRTLVFHRGGNSRNDVMLLGLDSGSTARPYLNSPADEFAPAVSPDGAWIAYASSESGRAEIYVRSFPTPGAKTQISLSGGNEPRWSRDGRELFYRNADQMMVATIQSRPTFSVLQRTELFRGMGGFPANSYFAQYDVSPDGRHFLMVQGDEAAQDLMVVLNWFDHLRGKQSRARTNSPAGQ